MIYTVSSFPLSRFLFSMVHPTRRWSSGSSWYFFSNISGLGSSTIGNTTWSFGSRSCILTFHLLLLFLYTVKWYRLMSPVTYKETTYLRYMYNTKKAKMQYNLKNQVCFIISYNVQWMIVYLMHLKKILFPRIWKLEKFKMKFFVSLSCSINGGFWLANFLQLWKKYIMSIYLKLIW